MASGQGTVMRRRKADGVLACYRAVGWGQKVVREVQKENRVMRYLRETRAELRKVVWPTRDEAINLTLIVVVTIIVMSVFFGTVDYLLAQLVGFLLGPR
jgi:preprotein translocase subunit SecE